MHCHLLLDVKNNGREQGQTGVRRADERFTMYPTSVFVSMKTTGMPFNFDNMFRNKIVIFHWKKGISFNARDQF